MHITLRGHIYSVYYAAAIICLKVGSICISRPKRNDPNIVSACEILFETKRAETRSVHASGSQDR